MLSVTTKVLLNSIPYNKELDVFIPGGEPLPLPLKPIRSKVQTVYDDIVDNTHGVYYPRITYQNNVDNIHYDGPGLFIPFLLHMKQEKMPSFHQLFMLYLTHLDRVVAVQPSDTLVVNNTSILNTSSTLQYQAINQRGELPEFVIQGVVSEQGPGHYYFQYNTNLVTIKSHETPNAPFPVLGIIGIVLAGLLILFLLYGIGFYVYKRYVHKLLPMNSQEDDASFVEE